MPGGARKISVAVHFPAVQINGRRVVAEQLECQPVNQFDIIHFECLPKIDRGTLVFRVGAVADFCGLVAAPVTKQSRPGLPPAVVKAQLGPVAAGFRHSIIIAPQPAHRHERLLQRRIGLGQAVQETIHAGETVIRRVFECAVGPKGQPAVLRLGQELRVGCRRHTGVVGQHALLALGQAQGFARLNDKLIRPRHHQALGQGRCLLCVHRPGGAEFVLRMQPVVQDQPRAQAVNPVAESAGGIGCNLKGVIPLGGVRTAVTFAPDEKHLCGVRHHSQAARERNRLLRSLDRRFADDLRQARFAAIRGDDLGNNQHVGTGQTAV